MPTKPAGPGPLTGLAAELASVPLAQTPRGGIETGFAGDNGFTTQPEQGEESPFAGMGPLLEQSDAQVFDLLDSLVIRQEMIARNHLAQDNHWTLVKLGYPWSTLTKEPNKDVYTQTLPYGASGITIQAVPNKSWDLINKATETLLVDMPEAECEPVDDSEAAEQAADMGNRFLTENASEQGLNEPALWNDRVSRSLVTATSYLEAWSDPVGGGSVPLQIKAHPQAVSPDDPLVGPDGNPTVDYVLRYVTADNQFTDEPNHAAPQWQPKLRASKWGREHICVYPESQTVDTAEKVIIKGFCTLGEAKRRWPAVAELEPKDLSALCDWTPQRYLVLLPPFQRARWKLNDAREKEKAGSSDERIMFYYHVLQRATPDHPKGADVVATGALDKWVIHRESLSCDVETERNGTTVTETRCLEIPVVQITPRQDPDEHDPTGRAFIEMFGGAAEFNAFLAASFAEAIDQTLHIEKYIPSTSTVEGWQVDEARASGDAIAITRPEDKPVYGQTPPIPPVFFDMYTTTSDEINSMASLSKPAQGNDRQQEVSGKARQIAVNQSLVGLSGMQAAVNGAKARWGRILIEQAMARFTTPMLIRYVGEDGASKQEEFVGTDFALVGKVNIKAGTGSMMPPDQKVQYIGNLQQAGLLDPVEAAKAARPSFAKRLGLGANPHEQYVERCVDSWLEGPPTPEWAGEYAAWKAEKDQYDQSVAMYQQQMQQFQEAEQLSAVVAGGPPLGLGPEGQNAQAMQQYQDATLRLKMNPYGSAFLANAPQQPAQAPVEPEAKPEAEAPHVAVERALDHVARIMPQSHPPAPQTIHVHTNPGKPKKKRSTIRKHDDGSYSVETDEEHESDEAVA